MQVGISGDIKHRWPDGDYRQDKDVKEEIYKNTDWGMFRIEGVFEDRKQCVDMWRRMGLTCYQVADGDY